ncbi:MAG: PQQ-dependent sugar dehydrogenase [Flavobacteriales bacterium]
MVRILVIAFAICLANGVKAQVWLEKTRIDTHTVASRLEIPWDIEKWSSDTIIFTERTGAIKRLSLLSGEIDTLYQEPADLAAEGQAGLMGLQLHPEFPAQPYLFVSLAYYDGAKIKVRVDRLGYVKNGDSLALVNTIVENIPAANANLGGRLFIDGDNHLLLSVGDIKDNGLPQDELSLNGKILRMNLDGSIPADNPDPTSLVYSMGHRNPQGITEDGKGHTYISEHGASSDDELNLLVAGANYGWPLVTGFCTEGTQEICDSLDVHEPLETWSPTIAPAGVAYFNEATIPEWENSILMCSLKEQRLRVVSLTSDGQNVESSSWILAGVFGRLRDVLVMGNRIYICTSNRDDLGTPTPHDDRIIELIPSTHNLVESIAGGDITYSVMNKSLKIDLPRAQRITIYSLSGNMVFNNPSQPGTPISLSHCPAGVYILVAEEAEIKPIKLLLY